MEHFFFLQKSLAQKPHFGLTFHSGSECCSPVFSFCIFENFDFSIHSSPSVCNFCVEKWYRWRDPLFNFFNFFFIFVTNFMHWDSEFCWAVSIWLLCCERSFQKKSKYPNAPRVRLHHFACHPPWSPSRDALDICAHSSEDSMQKHETEFHDFVNTFGFWFFMCKSENLLCNSNEKPTKSRR